MSEFTLGQRVQFSQHLFRKTVVGEGYYADVTKVWTSEPYPGSKTHGGEGLIIGRRTLSNGKNNYPGYDEPIEYEAKERFTAYLVAFDLRRKPVHVLPEHITALDA